MITLDINGQARSVDADPSTPLLWVLRDTLGLTGTKFGCGMALCGACTVHVDGEPVRSCSTPRRAGGGQEGHDDRGTRHLDRVGQPVQAAWVGARRAAVRLLPGRARS